MIEAELQVARDQRGAPTAMIQVPRPLSMQARLSTHHLSLDRRALPPNPRLPLQHR